MHVLGINKIIAFQRRPKPQEETGLRATINKTYDVMGTKNRIVITHGSCFPAIGRNTYIGSPYGKAAKEYIKFLMLYGFNGNQLGPGGELEIDENGVYPAPYSSSAFAKNRLFIDLEELTNSKYGNILSKNTYFNVTALPDITDTNYDESNFNEALKTYNTALSESFNNFKIKLKNGQPEVIKLNQEFQKFLLKHNERLTNEGIFKILSKHYGTDEFEKWSNELDRDLIKEIENQNPNAIKRYSDILRYNNKEIEQYKFEQFIATKQIKENKNWRDNNNFKYFNDLLVGCSKMDYWRCRNAFIDGYQLGVPQGEDSNPQIWHLPVLNPRKLFTADGLGVAGQFLKDKLDFALEFSENIRIDHVMGLIEPFVIKNSSLELDENKNPINNPHTNKINGQYMSQIYLDNGEKLDDYKNYSCDYIYSNGNKTYHSNIMNKIVLPTLKEHGINPKDAIWEDVCSQPEAFHKVFYEDLKLPGLSQTEWSKVESEPKENWKMLGSHDSIPAHNMIKRAWTKNSDAWNPLYLAGYLNMDNKRAAERDKFCDKIASDEKELVKAKFAELLTSDKFQISFADLFGITDTIYNKAGTRNNTNWKERISPDFLDKYYENLSSDNPTAINIPEVLKISLQAKIDMSVANSPNPDKTRHKLNAKYQTLLNELEKYANILKEPNPDALQSDTPARTKIEV